MPSPRPPKFQRRKADRPDEIVAAALEIFAEKGFAAARLDDIAARAGVSKGALYLYFPTKQDIFRAVVEQGVAPTAITATKYAADGTTITRQRPACAYPQVASYKGSGDLNVASNFQCVTPGADQLPTNSTDILLIQNSLRQRDVLTPNR